MNSFLLAAWRLLISRRFAIGLLMVIAALLIPGVLLPTEVLHTAEEITALQQNSPWLYRAGVIFNPPNMASSWTFIFLNVTLLVSTLLCTIERIRNRNFKDTHSREPKYFRQKQALEFEASQEEVGARAISVLRRAHWKISESEHAGRLLISGTKGTFGFWGSIVFHVGFLALLLGVMISANTRLNATILIAEGQTLRLAAENFTSVARVPKELNLPEMEIRIDEIEAVYQDGRFPVDYTTRLTFADPSGLKNAAVGVNRAARHGNLVFLMENFGYAPTFVVRDKDNKELLNGVINLKGRDADSVDSFDVAAADLHIETRFFPDYYEPTPGRASSRSALPKNPVYIIKATQGNRTLFSGPVAQGASANFAGYSLDFANLRKWAYLRVTQDKGVNIIFWGLVVAVTGLVVRFLLHERTIHIVVRSDGMGSKVSMAGKSRYFPALFSEEIGKLAARLGAAKGD